MRGLPLPAGCRQGRFVILLDAELLDKSEFEGEIASRR